MENIELLDLGRDLVPNNDTPHAAFAPDPSQC